MTALAGQRVDGEPVWRNVDDDVDPTAAIAWRPNPGRAGAPNPQAVALASTADELFYGGAKGGAKLLCLQTPLPTPNGWTTVGAVRVGDLLFDERGLPCAVTHLTPIVTVPAFRVRFDDGSILLAGGNHLWSVLLQRERANQARHTEEWRAARRESRASRGTGARPDMIASNAARATLNRPSILSANPWSGAQVMDTDALAAHLTTDPATKPAIPCTAALQLVPSPVLIDPYVLGAWLGDGTSANGGITCDDRYPWVIEELRRRGAVVRQRASKNDYGILGIRTDLRALGVLHNKHIPSVYLRGSIDQRRALLAGLMDTDGCVHQDGESSITTTKPQLASDYAELAASLGYKPSITPRLARCQTGAVSAAYNVHWFASDTPVTDPRKAVRLRSRTSPRARRRFIVSIERHGCATMRCIAVDTPSHLYLAGTGMIPTHNTDTLLAKPLYQVHKSLYAGAFVRQTYAELGRVLDRADRIYNAMPAHLRPVWNGEDHRYTWPSGAFVKFGYTDRSLEWTQGGSWAQVLWDEMANEPDERKVDTLISEIRCADPTVVRQLVGSGNPGFAGHPWIKRRFITPCGKRGEHIHFERVTLPDGRHIARSRQFVPSRVTDNPTYANDDAYMAALAQLPERMQRCLLGGDWDAATGLAFDEIDEGSDFMPHLIPAFDIPKHWPYTAGFDWGFVHNAVFMHARGSEDGRIYVVDTIYRRLMRDWDLAGVYEELVPLGARVGVQAGSDVKAEIKAREDVKSTMQTFQERGIHLQIGNTNRVFGYQNMLSYFAWKQTDYVPQRQPMVQFFDTPGNRRLLREIASMVNNPDDPRDVLKVNASVDTGEGGDDGYDALRVMLAGRPLVAQSGFDEIAVSAFDPMMLRAAAERAAKGAPLPRTNRRKPLFY